MVSHVLKISLHSRGKNQVEQSTRYLFHILGVNRNNFIQNHQKLLTSHIHLPMDLLNLLSYVDMFHFICHVRLSHSKFCELYKCHYVGRLGGRHMDQTVKL
jgi:hypothetical protein